MKLSLTAIREESLLPASSLEAIKGGAAVTMCNDNSCNENSGTCTTNNCKRNNSNCSTNNCGTNIICNCDGTLQIQPNCPSFCSNNSGCLVKSFT